MDFDILILILLGNYGIDPTVVIVKIFGLDDVRMALIRLTVVLQLLMEIRTLCQMVQILMVPILQVLSEQKQIMEWESLVSIHEQKLWQSEQVVEQIYIRMIL